MAVIRQLDPHVADLIAAGEVVERPASVVKELMENSIDAGACALTVEISHGGMALIRVTDDGCGIPADQAATAFLRHATSKISSAYDLEAIGTLGFRGEALAAISAVSRVELLTRPAQQPLGTSLVLEGGRVLEQEEAGCPAGTTMVVRDLVFNTPARQKFMKKDAAEGAAVFAAVQRIALSHPELSVKFIRDGRQELLTPGDGQLKSAVYAVMGRDIALGFLPVTGSGPNMSVTGFVSMPTCCRGSRSYQHFFVNGRYVKSRTMMAAVEEAYKNQKMVGRFPGCVIHLTMRTNEVDVNVHPAKTEVKFQNEQQVFTAVYHGVLSALNGDRSRPQAVLERTRGEDTVTPNQTVLPLRDRAAQVFADDLPPSWRSQAAAPAVAAPKGREENRFQRVTPLPHRTEEPGLEAAAAKETRQEPERPAAAGPRKELHTHSPRPARPEAPAEKPLPENGARPAEDVPAGEERPAAGRQPAPVPAAEEKPVPAEEKKAPGMQQTQTEPQASDETPAQTEEEPWQVRGELFHTYVLVEQGEKVLLIDKHAAHERANFDRLKAADYQPMVQQLLVPVTFTPPPEDREILLEQLSLLARFGFEVEEFGAAALAVRCAPDYLETGEIEPALLELAQRIRVSGSADPNSARDELLHTMACKAAIKGGQRNGARELEEVARMVMSGAVRYCPHGRPVAIELTRAQLEKQFKRT